MEKIKTWKYNPLTPENVSATKNVNNEDFKQFYKWHLQYCQLGGWEVSPLIASLIAKVFALKGN